MSCIEKMTIQGIRSYGPKDKDTQVIEFFFPVTLIVGQNGCGKTTVIECLKFATTSDMPPNTKGVSFVFDPKLIDEVEVKGRINLYFRDTSGLCVQVTKNLCVTQKAKKLEFRTAETIISRYSRENKLLSTITSKCINADAEVVNAFGVSKAVLEHVIFCHQEDSNWPLSEGKVLKTRFDEIFAATKYIKALDTLRKVRLEKSQLIKLKEQEKKFLQGSKERADQLKRELTEHTHVYENLKQKQEIINEKLKPIQKQLEAYFFQSNKIVEIKGQLDKVENEKNLLEKQIKELLVLTKHCMFTGSDEELREHVKEYSNTTDKMRFEEKETINKKLEAMNLQLKELNNKRSRFIIEIGALENKQKVYNQNREKLLQLLREVCTKIDGDLDQFEEFMRRTQGSCSEQTVAHFMNELKGYIEVYVSDTDKLESDYMLQNKKLEAELNAERDRKSKIDQNIETKYEIIEKNSRQIEQIRNDLKFIATDSVMEKLNSEIEQADNELDLKVMEMTDVNSIKKELEVCESKRSSLRKEESQIDTKLNKLHADSKAQTEIDLLKADKNSKEAEIKKIRLHIDEDLCLFFDVANNEDAVGELERAARLKDLYETRLKDVRSESNALELKNKEIEKRQCSGELKRKTAYEELRSKETLLRQYEDQLTTQLGECVTSPDDIERFDSVLEKLQEEHKANMDEKGFLNGVDKTYKRFLSQLQETTAAAGTL